MGETKFVFTILKNLNLHSSTAFELATVINSWQTKHRLWHLAVSNVLRRSMVKYNQHKQITVEKRFQLVQELSQLKLSDWIQSAPNTQTFK